MRLELVIRRAAVAKPKSVRRASWNTQACNASADAVCSRNKIEVSVLTTRELTTYNRSHDYSTQPGT